MTTTITKTKAARAKDGCECLVSKTVAKYFSLFNSNRNHVTWQASTSWPWEKIKKLNSLRINSRNNLQNNDIFTWQASSINELAEEVLAATSLLPLETLLVTR